MLHAHTHGCDIPAHPHPLCIFTNTHSIAVVSVTKCARHRVGGRISYTETQTDLDLFQVYSTWYIHTLQIWPIQIVKLHGIMSLAVRIFQLRIMLYVPMTPLSLILAMRCLGPFEGNGSYWIPYNGSQSLHSVQRMKQNSSLTTRRLTTHNSYLLNKRNCLTS